MTASPFAFLRRWDLQTPILGLCLNRRGDWFMAALGTGELALFPADDAGEDPQILKAHDGPSLVLTQDADDHAFLSGGADGRLFLAEPSIPAPTGLIGIAEEEIGLTAASTSGFRALVAGSNLYVLDPEGNLAAAPLPFPEPVTSLAFEPEGTRFAVAQTNRIGLFDAAALPDCQQEIAIEAPVLFFVWKAKGGSFYAALDDEAHTIQSWAHTPEGLFQKAESWTLEQKPASLALTAQERFLAASVGKDVLCLPLANAANGKPVHLGTEETTHICAMATHPKDDLIALGYEDGAVLLAPINGRREIVIFPPVAPKGARVAGLVWNAQGDSLHAALENGHVFLFTLNSVSRFIRGQTG